MSKPRLVLFDLDHTLLDGDSDVLWCDFLMAEGLLDRDQFAARNADMEARYNAGTVGTAEFANFYVGTLEGRHAGDLQPLRERFLREVIVPRIPQAAMRAVSQHLAAGDLVVITTATNRYLTERTAAHFGVSHLIATEPEVRAGVFTGRTTGVLNMRQGKVERLHAWLDERGERLMGYHSTAYSDSINDLPLLEAVDVAVACNADARLEELARKRNWRSLQLC